MNNGGEAADQMVREALQVTEVAIKLSALGIKNALALSLAYAKENPKVKGKTSLDRLLREGKELKIIALQSKDVGQFKELAKQYGVLFAVIKDKAQNEKVDVMFKAEDVAKLNRIYEQLEELPDYLLDDLDSFISCYGSLEELVEHKDDIILYSGCETMTDLVYYLIDEEQILGEIPSSLQNYIDYEAYGRDLDIEGTFIATNAGICEVLR